MTAPSTERTYGEAIHVCHRDDLPAVGAAQAQIEETARLGGGGAGLCAVDTRGNVALPFDTEGMYRGWMNADGVYVAIHEN